MLMIPTDKNVQPLPTPPAPTMKHIAVLCSSIAGCDNSIADLGYLTQSAATATQVHVHNTAIKPEVLDAAPVRTDQHQISGLSLGKAQRLEISASLCWAVLLLSSTKWLSEDLSQNELQLLLNSSSAQGHKTLQGVYVPFVPGSPTASVASLPASLAADTSLTIFTRNRTLFILGVMLIELYLGRSFENLKADPTVLIGTRLQNTPAGFGDLDLVSILADKVHMEAGEQYGNAVRRCLRCPFDGRDDEQNFTEPLFRKNFFFGVVAAVQVTYDRLSARVQYGRPS